MVYLQSHARFCTSLVFLWKQQIFDNHANSCLRQSNKASNVSASGIKAGTGFSISQHRTSWAAANFVQSVPILQSGPEKMHKVYCTVILQTFAVARGFHQNAPKRSLSTSHRKICISLLNSLWWTAGAGYMLWATSPSMWTWHLWQLKTSQTRKGWIVEFPGRQWKWHMLFYLLWITESTGFAKRLSCNDQCRLDWTDSNTKSINNLNCSQDGQPGT